MVEKKLALLICTFNRPAYLRRCLESVAAADLSQVKTILVIDDHSSDQGTLDLINDFELPQVELIKAFSKENRSIKYSLQFGFDLLFLTHKVCTNLDGDAIVSPDAFNRLLEMYDKFPGHIVTGFNCLTKNKNGTERHVVVEEGDGYNMKASVGGVNMIFNSKVYSEIIKPSLQRSLTQFLNWDHQSCLTSVNGFGKNIVATVPSCVQHIGIGKGNSSMGHDAGGEPADEAADFVIEEKFIWPRPVGKYISIESLRKLQLPSVTLIAVDDNISGIIKAADISCRDIEFGAVKLLSSQDSDDPRAIKIRHLGSKKEYSQFVLKELASYVATPFALIVQHDGYIIRPEAWADEFLNYDAVGAVWDFRDHKRTANGGCCIRSKRIIDAIANDPNIFLQNDNIINNYAEDHVLFYIYREYLEKEYSLKIAPEELCNKFSMESWGKKDKKYKGSFAFHGGGIDFSEANIFHKPY